MKELAKTDETALGAVRPLAVIEAELDLLKQDTRSKETALLSNYIEVGRRLEEAKAQLRHGEWGGWLKKMEISWSTANNFMRLFREYGADQQSLFGGVVKSKALENLTYTKALLLLAVPEEEREQFAAENNVADMTSRELEKAIKERDEARKAAEQAKVGAKAAEEARASMEQSLQAANELLDRTRADVKTAHDVTAELEKQLAELKAAPVEVAIATVDQEKLDAARAEGEAAKAAELADLQAKLDKAKEAKKKADEKRKDAEAALADAQAKLEASAKADKKAAAMADPDVAQVMVSLEQGRNIANVLSGLLLKFRNRGDQDNAERTVKAMNALGDKIKEAAQ